MRKNMAMLRAECAQLAQENRQLRLHLSVYGGGLIPNSYVPSLLEIQFVVAEHFGLTLEDMASRRRPEHIAIPRQIAMYLARMLTWRGMVEIGEAFGGRDHGTVIHACNSIENLIATETDTRAALQQLLPKIAAMAAKYSETRKGSEYKKALHK